MRLTLSVRSFQVPATPRTRAWPPRLPSVPTSRATRVTSEAKEPSWPTMVFTVLPMRRNSPRKGRPSISSCMVCDRSPRATLPITRETSIVGCTRSPISELTEFTQECQPPLAPGRSPRWPILPSLPTATPSRSNSLAIMAFICTTSLNAAAISPSIPVRSSASRTEKSPRRNARRAAKRLRDWESGRVAVCDMSGHPGEPSEIKCPGERAICRNARDTVSDAAVPVQGRFLTGCTAQLAIDSPFQSVSALLAGKAAPRQICRPVERLGEQSGPGEMHCWLSVIG